MSKTKVIKRDQTKEDFDPTKIIKVVKATGLKIDQAENIARDVQNWLSFSKIKLIKSTQIRDKIQELLKISHPHSASMFEQYQKSKK